MPQIFNLLILACFLPALALAQNDPVPIYNATADAIYGVVQNRSGGYLNVTTDLDSTDASDSCTVWNPAYPQFGLGKPSTLVPCTATGRLEPNAGQYAAAFTVPDRDYVVQSADLKTKNGRVWIAMGVWTALRGGDLAICGGEEDGTLFCGLGSVL